ncbi:hypothetical protein CHCC15322_1490 [Bacillus licheniformis]|nr:hypothetical protein CHCC20440_3104 [Bacillus licheniformis]TWL61641.1 hypothetical protein CHCC15322_1490 [Bacillus licheniformis]TWL74928.1 hypothetical protein CHCC15315_1867 [Bacillus licheniformis]TWM23903.1 hypothetical protein CHCC15087_4784 [Bacillus licheniformis]
MILNRVKLYAMIYAPVMKDLFAYLLMKLRISFEIMIAIK